MEKKETKLTELFELNSGKREYKGLDGITVHKVDIYKNRGLIELKLNGVSSLTHGNDAAEFLEDLETDFGFRINFVFEECRDGDIGSYIDGLEKLLLYMVKRDGAASLKGFVDYVRVDHNDGIELVVPGWWDSMVGPGGKYDLSSAFANAVYACCRIPSEAYEIKVLSVTSDLDEYSPEDDIIRAIESGTYEEFDGNYGKTPTKKGKKKKTETEAFAEDNDAASNKDSWAYKAAQVQKEAKIESKNTFDSIVSIFNKSQSLTGFGAAVGKLIDQQVYNNIAEVKSRMEDVDVSNVAEGLDLFTLKMDVVRRNAKKIGNDQRLFFYHFYRGLLAADADSYMDIKAAVEYAARQYERETM